MARFKDILSETEPGSGMVANPYAGYTVNPDTGEKQWIAGLTSIAFLDTFLGDLLPAQVPSVARSKIAELHARIDEMLGGSPGLKKLLDHLSETGQL